MLKISFSETPAEEKWILEGRLSGAWVRELRACWKQHHQTDQKRACIVDLNEVTFIDQTGEGLLRVLRDQGAQFIPGGCYVRHIVEQLKVRRKRKISDLLASFLVVFVLVLLDTSATRAQSTTVLGSVPSGPATVQIVPLTLRDAVNTALRYNLGAIESRQNAQIARGQRLLALSNLLPQVSAGASETVQQVNLATFGLSGLRTGIPTVVGVDVQAGTAPRIDATRTEVQLHTYAYGRAWKGCVTNLDGGTGSVLSLLPPENATGNCVKVVQRLPVRIDFERVPGQTFNAEGLLKPGLSVEPHVRVR